jgi:hypothetical protein
MESLGVSREIKTHTSSLRTGNNARFVGLNVENPNLRGLLVFSERVLGDTEKNLRAIRIRYSPRPPWSAQ